jgi:hypothetical protein
MKIITDKEGAHAIETACDNLLAHCRLAARNLVNQLMDNITLLPEEDDENEKQENANDKDRGDN